MLPKMAQKFSRYKEQSKDCLKDYLDVILYHTTVCDPISRASFEGSQNVQLFNQDFKNNKKIRIRNLDQLRHFWEDNLK